MAYRDDIIVDRGLPEWPRPFLYPPSDRNIAHPGLPRLPACPEIDCVRRLLSWETLAWAERRAADLETGADRVLIAGGVISEEHYLAALTRWLGTSQVTLDDMPRTACPLSDTRLIDAARTGLLPLRVDGSFIWVVAPRHLGARTLARLVSRSPFLSRRIALTSSEQLGRFAGRHGEAALGAIADRTLRTRWPQFSAAPRRWRFPYLTALIALATVGACYLAPAATRTAIEAGLAFCFLAWLALRLIGSFLTPPPIRPVQITDSHLPVYTIIVALYREAAAVEDLVAALRALDYPSEKLDVKLVVEADDIETGLALLRLELGPPFEVVTAPAVGPRTKPKALNAALALARGAFTAVYDAEDRPDPDQLRRALDAFLGAGEDLDCVQASLTIDNTDDSWLARLFTAEYAAQFDLFLPGLAALELPLPLGGSSNHFRTAALRKAGAWDPYNVTEDADLGMRLARFGSRSTIIRSSTYEEAPIEWRPWLRQRTRWFKGWMQTWLVHMRSPRRLLADLGIIGFLSFQLVVGGSVLAALIHPLVLGGFLYTYLNGPPFFSFDNPFDIALTTIYGSALVAGYLTSIFLGLRGLHRRGLMRAARWLALVPLHWWLLSAAAWRALYQLLREPQRWEKTEHGLARSSRRAKQASRTALGAVLGGDHELRREAAE